MGEKNATGDSQKKLHVVVEQAIGGAFPTLPSKGVDLFKAGCIMHSTSTLLVCATRYCVNGFTLDRELGESCR
jgi:fructose-1,6-bisphosphatase